VPGGLRVGGVALGVSGVLQLGTEWRHSMISSQASALSASAGLIVAASVERIFKSVADGLVGC
jgi:hypothetical protein